MLECKYDDINKGDGDVKFTKMHGTGNDFIMIDDRKSTNDINWSEKSVFLCDRHFGIGADGIILIKDCSEADVEMVIINADGSVASMCGNGIRCFAKYVYDNKILEKKKMTIKTGDGIKEAKVSTSSGVVKQVTINMGLPSFEPESYYGDTNEKEIINKIINIGENRYKITSLFMGVPHTVIFGELDNYDVVEGKNIEKYYLFKKGTNVNFCEVETKESIRVKTWERGVGPTLACGTGCCACVAASCKLGYVGKSVKVNIPGGSLNVDIKENGIYMTGPAVVSFIGDIDI